MNRGLRGGQGFGVNPLQASGAEQIPAKGTSTSPCLSRLSSSADLVSESHSPFPAEIPKHLPVSSYYQMPRLQWSGSDTQTNICARHTEPGAWNIVCVVGGGEAKELLPSAGFISVEFETTKICTSVWCSFLAKLQTFPSSR